MLPTDGPPESLVRHGQVVAGLRVPESHVLSSQPRAGTLHGPVVQLVSLAVRAEAGHLEGVVGDGRPEVVGMDVGLGVEVGQADLAAALYGGSPGKKLTTLWRSDLPVRVGVLHLLHSSH